MAVTEASTEQVAQTGLSYSYELSEDRSAPLLVMVHGRAGNLRVMWPFRRSAPPQCNVMAVQAPYPDPIGGFSWWLLQPGKERYYEEAGHAAAALRSWLERAIAYHQLTPTRTVAFGFSQGAGTLSVLLQEHPQLFDGVALLAGFVIQRAPESHPLPAIRILIAHGSNDETVPISVAHQGAEYLRARGASVELVEDPVGHKVGSSGMRRLREWTGSLLNV